MKIFGFINLSIAVSLQSFIPITTCSIDKSIEMIDKADLSIFQNKLNENKGKKYTYLNNFSGEISTDLKYFILDSLNYILIGEHKYIENSLILDENNISINLISNKIVNGQKNIFLHELNIELIAKDNSKYFFSGSKLSFNFLLNYKGEIIFGTNNDNDLGYSIGSNWSSNIHFDYHNNSNKVDTILRFADNIDDFKLKYHIISIDTYLKLTDWHNKNVLFNQFIPESWQYIKYNISDVVVSNQNVNDEEYHDLGQKIVFGDSNDSVLLANYAIASFMNVYITQDGLLHISSRMFGNIKVISGSMEYVSANIFLNDIKIT